MPRVLQGCLTEAVTADSIVSAEPIGHWLSAESICGKCFHSIIMLAA